MRQLNKKQQQELDKEIRRGASSMYDLTEERVREIENLNWHETFTQNADRYMMDAFFKRQNEG